MSTKIEWCDETVNIVAGCTKVSPGCDHCYAERMTTRLAGQGIPGYADGVVQDGRWTGKVVPIPGAVERLAAKAASWRKPRRVFVQSHAQKRKQGILKDADSERVRNTAPPWRRSRDRLQYPKPLRFDENRRGFFCGFSMALAYGQFSVRGCWKNALSSPSGLG